MAKFVKGRVPLGAVPFQPGQSGNPAGRPPSSRNRASLLRRWLDTPITVAPLADDATPEPGTVEDAVAVALLRRALTGDPRAFREVMDSVYGKVPAQPLADPAPRVTTVTLHIQPAGPPLASDEAEVVM